MFSARFPAVTSRGRCAHRLGQAPGTTGTGHPRDGSTPFQRLSPRNWDTARLHLVSLKFRETSQTGFQPTHVQGNPSFPKPAGRTEFSGLAALLGSGHQLPPAAWLTPTPHRGALERGHRPQHLPQASATSCPVHVLLRSPSLPPGHRADPLSAPGAFQALLFKGPDASHR